LVEISQQAVEPTSVERNVNSYYWKKATLQV